MSRFYEITISDPKDGKIFVPDVSGKQGFLKVSPDAGVATYTSLYQGGSVSTLFSTNPNAQRIEFDIPVSQMHAPLANSYVCIHGVTLGEIAQGSNLNGMNVVIKGGMAKGLPLANFSQAGILASGVVYQCFGDWIGTAQRLMIFVQAGGSSPSSNQTTGSPSGVATLPLPATSQNPANIVFQWHPGQPLMAPLVQAISTPYPQLTIAGAVHEGLVWTGQATTAFFSKLSQFATYLNKASLNLISGYAPDLKAYPGVAMALSGSTLTITDGTTPTTPKQLFFSDLVGQPTLVGPGVIQVTTVLRGDLEVNQFLSLPDSNLQVTGAAQTNALAPPTLGLYASPKNKTAYSGSFLIVAMRHVGNSRDGSGTAWVTTIDLAAYQPLGTAPTVDALPIVQKPNKSRFDFYIP